MLVHTLWQEDPGPAAESHAAPAFRVREQSSGRPRQRLTGERVHEAVGLLLLQKTLVGLKPTGHSEQSVAGHSPVDRTGCPRLKAMDSFQYEMSSHAHTGR